MDSSSQKENAHHVQKDVLYVKMDNHAKTAVKDTS